jgi:hypothetical protein
LAVKNSKGFFWAYIDLLFALVAGFMAMACMAVVAKTTPQDPGTQIGNLTVEMQWPAGSESDIDLWVQPPGDRPIGYSRKTGKVCDLIRDDLGATHDLASRAMEMVACRTASPGEYVVNVYAYTFRDHAAIPVRLFVRHQRAGENTIEPLLTQTTTLDHNGQEVTVARFTLDRAGQLVQGSVGNLYKGLRSSLE